MLTNNTNCGKLKLNDSNCEKCAVMKLKQKSICLLLLCVCVKYEVFRNYKNMLFKSSIIYWNQIKSH